MDENRVRMYMGMAGGVAMLTECSDHENAVALAERIKQELGFDCAVEEKTIVTRSAKLVAHWKEEYRGRLGLSADSK